MLTNDVSRVAFSAIPRQTSRVMDSSLHASRQARSSNTRTISCSVAGTAAHGFLRMHVRRRRRSNPLGLESAPPYGVLLFPPAVRPAANVQPGSSGRPAPSQRAVPDGPAPLPEVTSPLGLFPLRELVTVMYPLTPTGELRFAPRAMSRVRPVGESGRFRFRPVPIGGAPMPMRPSFRFSIAPL